mmetsp:Transcript_23703/g.78046  ORF Transcript_23703/g.78046 Transcript_23703/m.78046 type:complete len:251 (-) Transcript_23703:418-1170(-)
MAVRSSADRGSANVTARLTTSWPKRGAESSRTQRFASGSSFVARYSWRSMSTTFLSSELSRPSPGPQMRSNLESACSRLRRRRARATMSPPSATKTRSPRYAGGSASSTTHRTRKSPTTSGARGASSTKSSMASKRRSKPLATSRGWSSAGHAADSSRDTSSHSRARRSTALDTPRLTTSKPNSGQLSSTRDVTHSSTSPDAKSSSSASTTRRLNSASVYLGPINVVACSGQYWGARGAPVVPSPSLTST